VPSYGDERPFETPLPVNLGHKKIAVGSSAAVGVKEDGTVWAWGSGGHGELGNGREIHKSYVPVQISDLNDVIEVDTGGQTFYALKRDGTVWSWGLNDKGQLGYDTPEIRLSSKFGARPGRVESLKDILSIVGGADFLMALSAQGDIYVVGHYVTLMPDGKEWHRDRINDPKVIARVPQAKRLIYMRGGHALLSQDGDYWLCCQWEGDRYSVEKGEMKVVDLATSGQVGLYLLPNGHVLAKGGNSMGGLGQGDTKEREGFVRVKNIGRIVDIEGVSSSPFALDEKGISGNGAATLDISGRSGQNLMLSLCPSRLQVCRVPFE